VSIWGSFFGIEDERQWVAELEAEGIKAGIIRDGEPLPEDLDAPLVYQGSHVLPEADHPRGGSVDLAHVAAHVRFWREHPDAPPEQELEFPHEPYLRLSVHEDPRTPYRSVGDATVLLTTGQARRLIAAVAEWLEHTAS